MGKARSDFEGMVVRHPYRQRVNESTDLDVFVIFAEGGVGVLQRCLGIPKLQVASGAGHQAIFVGWFNFQSLRRQRKPSELVWLMSEIIG